MLMNLTALIIGLGSAGRGLMRMRAASTKTSRGLPDKACSGHYGNGCLNPRPEPAPMSIVLDDYVLESLMPDLVGHDHHPSAFLLYLALWRLTGGGEREAVASLRQLAEETGLSRRAVQDAAARLAQRQLVEVRRGGITEVPAYHLRRPWLRG
jgi:hypothetical protein